MAKTYTVKKSGRYNDTESSGTIEELLKYHSYTLEVGKSWEHEKGNSKINEYPKTGASLVSNLNKSARNLAADGNPSSYYSLV